jgi:dynein heavy chain
MCQLFDNQILSFPRLPEEDYETWRVLMEKLFVYCLIWSVGGTVEERSRKDIDYILRDIESIFPHQNTIYEHYLNVEKRDWSAWEERIPATYKPQEKDLEFHIIQVPTVDTARNKYLVQSLLKHGSQILLVGHTGVGKTALVENVLLSLDISVTSFSINFSAGTTSESTQKMIESNFERRTKSKYNPKNAKKKAICFVDDLNMPRKDLYGSQPPLELIRQWIDYGSWYNREKLTLNLISGLQFLCCMGKPGGGRAEISQRLMSKYHIINYTIPDDSQMKRIFESIAAYKLQGFEEEVKNLTEPMAVSTINLFSIISEKFLPTPAKSHYVFNMRDISKVFHGIYRADKGFHDTKEQMVQLWAHEVLRVFQDRLVNEEDQKELRVYLDEQLETHFQMSFEEYCLRNGENMIYVDFLNENKRVYEEVQDFEKLREYLISQLEKYNDDPKLPKMDLVLFKDAIHHTARVYRVLTLKRGHAFLVGVGGSGRHSVTHLASFLNQMTVFQVSVTRGFGIRDFRDFLKNMYEHAGFRGKRRKESVFIFSENDIVMEAFLEDVNNMLSSGLVPNLYANEELAKIREEIRVDFKKEGHTLETNDALNEFFYSRVKDNLHITICMSPLGRAFKDYCRMYPALINNTTIDWFMKWPEDALIEVAKKYISKIDVPTDLKEHLANLCCHVHVTVGDNADLMLSELKRVYNVTPTNYIDLLTGYERILKGKRKEIGDQINKLRSGLDKLDDARKQVEEMTVQSEVKRAEVSKEQKQCEELMVEMSKQQTEADEKMKVIETERIKIGKEKAEIVAFAAVAEQDLKKAEPALIAAEESLEKLDKKYIAEIKSFPSPPAEVEMVMYAVMVILGKDTTWLAVKKELADPQFVKKIKEFDKDKISQSILKKIERYTKKEEFDPAYIEKKSEAAGALCVWVRSMEDYAKALKVVNPKRQRKAQLESELQKKMEYLKVLEDSYKEVTDKLSELNRIFEEANHRMESLKKELENLQFKIDTGEKLVSNLSGEKERWEASLSGYDVQFEKLTGDCIISASVISYNGPFTSEYRDNLVSLWINNIQAMKIPYTQHFDFSDFLVGQAVVREWNMKGLPTDKFSIDNGVMVKKSNRWPLMIDPQSQGLDWTSSMEGRKLLIADIKDPKYLNVIEKAVSHGKAVIMPDVGEDIDPTLYPLLEKSTKKILGKMMIKIGSKEIEYNDKFRLFITTRMSNPNYTPDISTRVCLINFTVKETGLEEQLLAMVVEMEQESLEKNKNEQVQKIAKSKRRLIELEDQILSMLSNSKVSLIEDIELVKTLETSKNTSDEVKQSLESSEQTMKRIDEAREAFRPCGKQASLLFFVLSDLNKINPMYQFSLSWYKDLFRQSIETSRENPFQDRIQNIMKEHTLSVYRNACMSLFERHKLLLSLQM